jgi:hypothetical protein
MVAREGGHTAQILEGGRLLGMSLDVREHAHEALLVAFERGGKFFTFRAPEPAA